MLLLVLWIIIWGLLNIRHRKYAPIVIFMPALIFAMVTNLQLREQLPDFFQDTNMKHADDLNLYVLIFTFSINYTSFVITAVILPPLYMTSYYFQL